MGLGWSTSCANKTMCRILISLRTSYMKIMDSVACFIILFFPSNPEVLNKIYCCQPESYALGDHTNNMLTSQGWHVDVIGMSQDDMLVSLRCAGALWIISCLTVSTHAGNLAGDITGKDCNSIPLPEHAWHLALVALVLVCCWCTMASLLQMLYIQFSSLQMEIYRQAGSNFFKLLLFAFICMKAI